MASFASTADLRAAALSPSLVSTGIKNLGNTCYMNAQLQCAFHIPLIRQLAMESTKEDSADDGEETPDTTAAESDAKVALRELFLEMILAATNGSSAVTPRSFCVRLGIPPMVQQDSQEFWKLLLPALEQEEITDLYKGSFESYITALDGSGRERRREELYLDLSLDIGKSPTLMDSLKEGFGEPELLSNTEGNGWRPEKGAEKVDAHKGSSLIAAGLPPILQFHMKRFTYDWQTDSMTKLNSRLEFPLELDLSTICKSIDGTEGGETIYDLQGVVIHVGKYGMGHYYAYVRPDPTSDQWFRFNDDHVEAVTEKEVFEDAYGGKNSIRSQPEGGKKRIPVLGRFLRRFGSGNGSSYGYGGSESNAYVVQYVRRKDIGKLYLED